MARKKEARRPYVKKADRADWPVAGGPIEPEEKEVDRTRGVVGAQDAVESTGESSLFEAMQDDAYVNIRRRDPRSQQWAYCGRLAPPDAREEILKERGGGGVYDCKEMIRNPSTGKFQYGRQRGITVEGVPFPWKEPLLAAMAAPVVPVNAAGDPMGPQQVLTAAMLDVLRAGREGAEAQAKATAALIDSVTQRGGGGAPEWLPAVLGALAPLLERLLNPPAPVNPMEAMLTGMKLAKEMGNPATSMRDQFAAMEQMLDLKQKVKELEAGPEPGTGDPLMDTIQQNLPRVLELLASMKDGTRPAPAPALSRALPSGVSVPAAPAPAGGNQSMWLIELGKLRKPLLSFAQRGKAADMVAEHVLEFMLPERYKGDLSTFLMQGPPALAQFLQFAPEFQPYQQWVGEVMETMLLILHPEMAEGEDGEGAEGGLGSDASGAGATDGEGDRGAAEGGGEGEEVQS